jgi:hypothetical protein
VLYALTDAHSSRLRVHDIQPVDEPSELGKPRSIIDVERLEDECEPKSLFP